MKNFYKKTRRRVRVDGKRPVGFDKKKLECFNLHNTSHFARECTAKGTHNGKKKRDSFYQHQEAGKQEKNQMGLLIMDDGFVNWGEHTKDELQYRFTKTDNFKGVAHPLSGDYTSKPQEEIDDPLYWKDLVEILDSLFGSESVSIRSSLKNTVDRGILDSGCSRVLTAARSFSETECLVVSFDFKMPDENQILLKVPRHHNMYSFDMKTPSLIKGFACLIAKANLDESRMWHRMIENQLESSGLQSLDQIMALNFKE
ncbi:hypothetical protein Tco_0374822 [Tanacetum coccineum]